MKYNYSWQEYEKDLKKVYDFEFDHIVGIYRGGLPLAINISNSFKKPMSIVGFQSYDGQDSKPYWILNNLALEDRVLIVDDIYDTGNTMRKVSSFLEQKKIKFCLFGKDNKDDVVFCKQKQDNWIIFPWERI